MKSCDGTEIISNNESTKPNSQGGRHLGQYNPTIQLALTLYDEKCGQRFTFADNNMAEMADKKREGKVKRERSKGKEEKRKRKRSENDEIELAKHYETL